jgi:hypothetical protein
MKKIFLSVLICISFSAFSIDFYAVYPSHWWVGMKNNKLQLLLHGENVGMFTKVTMTYPGITVNKVTKTESKNYLIVDVTISPATKAGRV